MTTQDAGGKQPYSAAKSMGYVKSGLKRETGWWGAFVIGLAGTILVTGIAPVMVTTPRRRLHPGHGLHHADGLAALPLPGRALGHDARAHRRLADLRLSRL